MRRSPTLSESDAENSVAPILLLETPFMSQTGGDEVRAYVQSKYNLALPALGSYVRAKSDLGVRLINMVKDRIGEDDLIQRLRSAPPKVVGVPLYSYNLNESCRIIARIKQEFPDAPTSASAVRMSACSRPKRSNCLTSIRWSKATARSRSFKSAVT